MRVLLVVNVFPARCIVSTWWLLCVISFIGRLLPPPPGGFLAGFFSPAGRGLGGGGVDGLKTCLFLHNNK